MKIETKFKPTDSIWFYCNGKATEAPIYKVDVEVYESSSKIRYMAQLGKEGASKLEFVDELFAFSTKEDLINSL